MAETHRISDLLPWIEAAGYEYFFESIDGADVLVFGPSLANGDSQWHVSYASEGYVNVTLIGERDGRGHWRAGFVNADFANRWLMTDVGLTLRHAKGMAEIYVPSRAEDVGDGATVTARNGGAGRTIHDVVINGTTVAWFASKVGARGATCASHILPLPFDQLEQLLTNPDVPMRYRQPPALEHNGGDES